MDGPVDEESAKDWQETTDRLDAAIETLPPAERRIVRQHYYHKCPCDRIGRFEGVSRAMIKWRLVRARKLLRSHLQIGA